MPSSSAARVEDQSLVAEDPVSRELVELAARVAASDATVMLTGESGVGKEVLARFVHRRSKRSTGPFVAINCAAIPENMLEAMLFGYERGAFTNAMEAHAGKFEQADGGTLLLDEITEMELGLQAKLLRVLQEREIERLGGRHSFAVDVRVVATTNRDLKAAVATGRFREDLFYRLNVFPLCIPPLRRRRRDILPLAERFLSQHRRADGSVPELSERARKLLVEHDWPGNVRELDNVMQRALILGDGCRVDAEAIRLEEPEPPPNVVGEDEPAHEARLQDQVQDREERIILDTLREEKGRRKDAAARLGISPRTLRHKLARMRETGVALP